MKKSIFLVIAIILIALITVSFVVSSKKDSINKNEVAIVNVENVEDLERLIDSVYQKSGNDLFGLETRKLDLSDEMALTTYTGLTSNKELEAVVISECMVTSKAYSLAIVKTNEGADVETIKQEMVDNVDMRRWICVEAEVVYATNYNNVIFLVMSEEDLAKPQYDAFKNIVGGKVGKELVRQSEILDF